MPQTCLTSSRRGDMQALAVRGIFATDCYPQIHGLIRRALGPDCAALLAEPQHDAAQQRIDWYTSREGTAVPANELPPEAAQALREKAARHAAAIAALARRHEAAPGDMAGDMALLALRHVAEDDLWSVGGEPVLINWGFAPGRAGAQAQDLSRLGATPPPAPPVQAATTTPPPVAPTGGHGCLWWLLPLLLLLLLLWLLLAALGYLPSPLPAACAPLPDTAALDKEKARTAPLESELETLLRQLRERAALCAPPAPEPAEKAAPQTVEPFFGESPREEAKPEPKPVPKPEPKPAPKPQARKGDKMEIPENAAREKDLSFLEGCWASDTGLKAVPSGKPVIVEYCFDKRGNGKRYEHVEGQESCVGPGTARFQGNRLHMESPYAQCPDGTRFIPHSIDCTGSGNTTLCNGREHDDKGTRWTARFRKQ